MTLNEGFIGEFAAEAHKRGITDSQFQGLVSWYLGKNVADAGTQADAKAAVAAQTETVLKKDWGAAYDQNLGLAKSALAEYFGDAMVEHLEKTGLGNHPDMLKGFAKLGQQLAEDGKLTGKANGSAAIAAPTEAQQQINGMMKDQAFLRAWKDKGDPGHQAALDKMQALYAQAYPGEG